MRSGTSRINSMIGRQNHGRYTTSLPPHSARYTPLPTVEASAQSGFFGKSAVIGVSTNPGLMVTTRTPRAMEPIAQPLKKYRHRSLGCPIDVVALPTAISGNGGNDRDRAFAPLLAVVSDTREQGYDAHEVGLELRPRRIEGLLAGCLVRQGPMGDEHRVESAQTLRALVDQRLVTRDVVQIRYVCLDLGRATHPQIIGNGAQLLWIPARRERAGHARRRSTGPRRWRSPRSLRRSASAWDRS